MRTVVFSRYGRPEVVVSVIDQPTSPPGPGEAVIRMVTSPVNPADLLYVRGDYAGLQPSFPARIGLEGVGVIEQLGDEPGGGGADLTVGQRVMFRPVRGRTWAEQVLAPTADLVAVPAGITDEQAASFMINPAAALLMVRTLDPGPGQWLLQSAAGSELARMVTRLGRRNGFRTISVVRRRAAIDQALAAGADAAISPEDGPLPDHVRAITAGAGVDYALDAVAGETGTQLYQALAPSGRMLVYGSLSGEAIRIGDDPRLILAGRRVLEVFWLGGLVATFDRTALGSLVAELTALVHDGTLATHHGRRFALDEVGQAITEAESVARDGKVLLGPR